MTLLALTALVILGGPVRAQGPLDRLGRAVRAQQAFHRGRSLYEQGRYREARDRLTEALGLAPEHDEARALLAWAQYHLGEFRAAAISFKAIIRRQPSWDGPLDGLGWSRLRLGRHHLAIDAFEAALERNRGSTDALIGLGTARFELGRYEAALAPLQQALASLTTLAGAPPEEAIAAQGRVAWSLYYLGRYREASEVFGKAIRTTPGSHGLHNGLGWCALRLGDQEAARRAFREALRLDPGSEDALAGLRQAGG